MAVCFVVILGEDVLNKRMGNDSLEDERIIQLYIEGDESALKETEQKYGEELKKLSFRITGSRDDSLECLNDTLMQAWKTVGTVRPDNLRAYLAKVIRNVSIDCLKKRKTQKRNAVSVALEELGDCLPDASRGSEFFEVIDEDTLSEEINRWLAGIGKEKRVIFVRRYFKMETAREIAKSLGTNEGSLRVQLSRLRCSLKEYLESKGYAV